MTDRVARAKRLILASLPPEMQEGISERLDELIDAASPAPVGLDERLRAFVEHRLGLYLIEVKSRYREDESEAMEALQRRDPYLADAVAALASPDSERPA